MCGICGIALASGGSIPSRTVVERMCASIVHRGPDDQGIYLSDSVGLGHRRLSIVDLSGGHQPMANEDNRTWISFNGEIYNHAELRSRLIARGHEYRTASDTESILHLYEEGGPAAFAELQGMFAFGIWDEKRKSLILARDHSGIKPLYYAVTPRGDLLFGSEVKALFASGALAPALDAEVLPEYFATGHVSGERTLLAGVKKLPPGHWLTWQHGSLRTGRFWSLAEASGPTSRSGLAPGRMADVAGEFWRRFQESVRLQLMSDVPLGAFLSGGVDSSLIVAAMVELGVESIETFSVGYADREANELPFAQAVATRFNTRHHEVSLSAESYLEALPRLTWQRDFPLTFSASIPLAIVAELARSHVKVVLTGEGSDELFAGYGRYPRALLNLKWARRLDHWLPAPARRALRRSAARLGDGFIGSRVRRSFLGQDGSAIGAYLEPFSDFGLPDRLRLLESRSDPFARVVALVDSALLERDPLEALLRLDQETYLEELLMKQDTMSMTASIESRVPFLDHTLREWASRVSSPLKLQGWTGKALVRAAAAEHLPGEIAHAGKRGFPVPLARWLRLPTGREMLRAYALRDLSDFGLRHAYPQQLFSEHMQGRDHSAKLWRLLAFAVWAGDTLPRLGALAQAPPGIGCSPPQAGAPIWVGSSAGDTVANQLTREEWEKAEVERSAIEAALAAGIAPEKLLANYNNCGRYLDPPADTVYPLEYCYHLLGDVSDKTVLDYGCGTGENTMILARRGGRVKALDISADLIRLAEARIAVNGLEEAVEFIVGSAHQIPVPSESVDLVFGMAILHHLDLAQSAEEVWRVLKPGGKAIFQEPVQNSRFVRLVRKLIPYRAPDVSPYERPLTDAELQQYGRRFSRYHSRAFLLPTTRIVVLFPRVAARLAPRSYRLDAWLLAKLPLLRHFSVVRVIEVIK